MVDENLGDEDFDKPDPATKLDDKDFAGDVKKKSDDAFKDDESDTEDDLVDFDVEIESEGDKKADENDKKDDKFKAHSEEGRFGKRRHKNRNRDSRLVRDLESRVNQDARTIDELKSRLDAVESTTSRTESSSVDSQINEAQRYLDQAKSAHAAAVKDGDGDRAAEALDVMMEARDTLTMLRTNKTFKDGANDKRVIKRSDNLPEPDPAVMRMFNRWHMDNDWYDPGLRDRVSRIAFHIDNAMNAEGYDPRTPKYWTEFDKRLKANPTIAKEVFEGDIDDEPDYEEDEDMDDKQTKRASNNNTPRRPQTERSSSATGAKKKIVVSRERAHAMREMGLQPGTLEWKKMAKKYENYDKQRSA